VELTGNCLLDEGPSIPLPIERSTVEVKAAEQVGLQHLEVCKVIFVSPQGMVDVPIFFPAALRDCQWPRERLQRQWVGRIARCIPGSTREEGAIWSRCSSDWMDQGLVTDPAQG